MSRRVALAVLGLTAACTTDAPPPGDVMLGAFSLNATPVERTCSPDSGMSFDPFSFEATLTANSTSEHAWLTMSRYSRDAGWDGQYFTSVASSLRVFPGCEACQSTLEERFAVALLSQSQTEVLHGLCPPNALDGGVPSADLDAGITAPGMTDTGFDATRACGTLTAVMHSQSLPDAGDCPAECDGCSVLFGLEGVRR